MAYSNAAAVALKERLASGGNAFSSSTSTPKVTTAPTQNTSVAQQKYNDQQAFKAVADSKVAGTYADKVNNTINATVADPNKKPVITTNNNTITTPTYKAPTTITPTSNIVVPQYDPTNEINQIKAMQKEATLQSLEQKRQQNLANLESEQIKLKPQYDSQRSNTNVQSQLSARNFAEFMAQRGQNNSNTMNGTLNQNEITRGGALQGAIGSLNTDEALKNSDIETRRTQLGSAYNSDVAQANAAIEAQSAQSLILAKQNKYNVDSQNAVQQTNWNRADTTNLNNWAREDATTTYNQEMTKYNAEQAKIKSAKDEYTASLKDAGYVINPLTNKLERNTTGMLADNTVNKTNNDIKDTSKKTVVDAETKQYGYPLSDSARGYKDMYTQALENPIMRQYINEALKTGNIREYQNNLVNQYGAENPEIQQVVNALEGARINKLLSNPLLIYQYGSEYGMTSPKIASDALKYITDQADSAIKQAQANTVSEVESLKLEKAKQDLLKGNYDTYVAQVKALNINEREKLDLINLGLQGQNIINTMANRDDNTSQGYVSLNQGQQRIDDSRDNKDYDNMYEALTKFQTTPKYDVYGKVVGYDMDANGKENALNMIKDAAQKGASKSTINKLLTNLNLNGK